MGREISVEGGGAVGNEEAVDERPNAESDAGCGGGGVRLGTGALGVGVVSTAWTTLDCWEGLVEETFCVCEEDGRCNVSL